MTPKIVGFVCDWAVATAGIADATGHLVVHPSVAIIRIPCSGFIRASWLEDTLKAGADGVFVVGCPYGDCLNREGNYLVRDRVEQLQRRLQRRKVDAARLTMMAHGLHDVDAFLSDVGAIVDRLSQLSAPAPARTPSAAGSQAGREPAQSEEPAPEGRG
jgi:F420-non-reducing hydrogenase iron-sulfur subunit